MWENNQKCATHIKQRIEKLQHILKHSTREIRCVPQKQRLRECINHEQDTPPVRQDKVQVRKRMVKKRGWTAVPLGGLWRFPAHSTPGGVCRPPLKNTSMVSTNLGGGTIGWTPRRRPLFHSLGDGPPLVDISETMRKAPPMELL